MQFVTIVNIQNVMNNNVYDNREHTSSEPLHIHESIHNSTHNHNNNYCCNHNSLFWSDMYLINIAEHEPGRKYAILSDFGIRTIFWPFMHNNIGWKYIDCHFSFFANIFFTNIIPTFTKILIFVEQNSEMYINSAIFVHIAVSYPFVRLLGA